MYCTTQKLTDTLTQKELIFVITLSYARDFPDKLARIAKNSTKYLVFLLLFGQLENIKEDIMIP